MPYRTEDGSASSPPPPRPYYDPEADRLKARAQYMAALAASQARAQKPAAPTNYSPRPQGSVYTPGPPVGGPVVPPRRHTAPAADNGTLALGPSPEVPRAHRAVADAAAAGVAPGTASTTWEAKT